MDEFGGYEHGETSMRGRTKAFPVLGAFLATLALVVSMAGCAEPEKPETVIRPVKMVVLGGAGEQGNRIFPGSVQAARRAELSFRVSGPLVQFPVSNGEPVRQGQLLAQIDPRDFQTRVLTLEARLADLKAQHRALQVARPEDIRRFEAGLAAAQSSLIEASATFRRYQRLYEKDNVSKAEYDQRRAARDVAEAQVRVAEESLGIATSGARPEDIEAMEARIQSMGAELGLAKDQLADTSLTAPYQGMVVETYLENFEFVRAQEAVLSLQDIRIVEIVAQIPENVVARAREEGVETAFSAHFESLPGKEFPAKLTEIAAQADVMTRTYAVTFQTPQPEEGRILSGMTAEIIAHNLDAGRSTFAVPVDSIFGDSAGNQFVWIVLPDLTVERREVEVDELVGVSAFVTAGLSPGERVVTAGTNFLSDGQQVREITDELRERK